MVRLLIILIYQHPVSHALLLMPFSPVYQPARYKNPLNVPLLSENNFYLLLHPLHKSRILLSMWIFGTPYTSCPLFDSLIIVVNNNRGIPIFKCPLYRIHRTMHLPATLRIANNSGSSPFPLRSTILPSSSKITQPKEYF